MAINAYSSPLWYATVGDFRAWGKQLSDALQAAGLVKDTTATSQINWTTVNNPGAINVSGGYEIFRFDDALQATAPVFIKLEYGFPQYLSVPGVWLTVGTTVNAGGNIGGISSTRQSIATPVSPTLQYRPLLTNICVLPGYVGCVHKRDVTGSGYAPNCNFLFLVARTVDETGANTGEGVFILTTYSGATNTPIQGQCLGFTGTGFVSGVNSNYALLWGDSTPTNQNTNDVQVFKSFGVYPRVRPNPYALLYYRPEIHQNAVFKAMVQGTTSHYYLALDLSGAPFGAWGTDSNRAMAMRYQ